VVIGAGAIGMEFGSFYNALGTKITIIEMLDRVLPIEDPEVSKVVERGFKKKKMKVLTKHMLSSIDTSGDKVVVTVKDQKKDAEKVVEGDVVLMAIGIRGNIENLGLEEVGVECDRSFIKADPARGYRTSVDGIHAFGDVIGPPLLAHVASHEAIICVESIAGLDPSPMNYDAIPGCTFCHPQVGSIGLSEEAAREAGMDVKVGMFPFIGVGKAIALGEKDGFVKLVCDGATGRLVGGHIVGPEAPELLGELELAVSAGLTARQIAHGIHSHPTLHEAIMEAALDVEGAAIHV